MKQAKRKKLLVTDINLALENLDVQVEMKLKLFVWNY